MGLREGRTRGVGNNCRQRELTAELGGARPEIGSSCVAELNWGIREGSTHAGGDSGGRVSDDASSVRATGRSARSNQWTVCSVQEEAS